MEKQERIALRIDWVLHGAVQRVNSNTVGGGKNLGVNTEGPRIKSWG